MNGVTLVTGASGFIGRHLCKYLSAKEENLRLLVRSNSALSNQSKAELVTGDLEDEDSLLRACDGVERVFHLAGIAHAGTSIHTSLKRVNVEGTENLLKACRVSGVRRVVFISSIMAQPLDGSAELGPLIFNYANSKKLAEEILLGAQSQQFQVTILRPVNVYGPGMKGNIASLIRRINNGSLPPLPNLENTLSLVGVEDVCKAALLAAEQDTAVGEIYPLSDGVSYTPNSIEGAIYDALGRKKPGWRTPRMVFYAASLGAQIANNLGVWKNDIGLRTYRNLVGEGTSQTVSCEKITTELGYQPSQTFYDALPDIIEHMRLD